MKRFLIDSRIIFDSHIMTLSHGDRTVRLTHKETELLCMVINGDVAKRTAIETIWERKGECVSESCYYQLVRSLRVKFETSGCSRNILITLPRRGLRFLGEVEPVDDDCSSVAHKTGVSGTECSAEGGACLASNSEAVPADSVSKSDLQAVLARYLPDITSTYTGAACASASCAAVPYLLMLVTEVLSRY